MTRHADSTHRRRAAALAATLAIVLAPFAAAAQSGLQLTPDTKRTLINKDVADERWAITRNPDGTVTGNVFFPGGGAPKFIWCQELAHAGGEVSLACSGADACVLTPCEANEWAFIAQVTLPEAFFGFAPTNPYLSVDTPAPRGIGGARTADATENSQTGAGRGLQLTPDRLRALVSKDVGGERWAITRNDDGTVTGNVFVSGGGAPKFLWCNERSAAADVVDLACFGADACAGEVADACRSVDWQFITAVSLPSSFLEPSEQMALDSVVAAIAGTLGDDGAFDAVALALDKGYSLRQVARAGLSGRLRSWGEIVERSGAPESPAGPPLDLFDTAPLSVSRGRPPGMTLDTLREMFRGKTSQLNNALLAGFLALVSNGYPVDQIVEHVVLGGAINNADLPCDPPPCHGAPDRGLSLVDDSGQPIPPDKPREEVLLPPQPSPTPVPTPTPPPSICGNGDVESGEQCDGLDLDGWTCEAMGFNEGTLRCTSGCRLDTSGCRWIPPDNCGDGRINAREDCDGANLNGYTCEEIYAGYNIGGTLRCKADCTFDTSGCQSCPGQIDCEGFCAPIGADCCEGLGGWCPPGTFCTGTQICCPADAPKVCGTSCLPADGVCCPSGGGCLAGWVCAGSGKCCPAGSPFYCPSTDDCSSGPCF